MHKDQVRRFYEVLWDANDKTVMPSILHENFSFRGSLGQQKQGYQGFSDYVDMVHKALGDYQCIIEELVEEGDKVVAKMTFTGIHREQLMGYLPSHKRVSWAGCALFTFEGERICDVWVLGDLKSLENQLKENEIKKL